MVGQGGRLFFAPGIGFDEVDPNAAGFPDLFELRVEGFYLIPADDCIAKGHAFAAGLLLVSCIDALARLKYGTALSVHGRFTRFALNDLASFAGGLSERFYDECRNGLVHEGRLKAGAQFSFERGQTVDHAGALLIVNPAHLIDEVRAALRAFVVAANSNLNERARLAQAIMRDNRDDFRAAGSRYVP
jgi:hypothetical protein